MGEKHESFSMTIVTIIVYDRFENLERWVNCMKGSPYQLVVIHNDNGQSRKLGYKGKFIVPIPRFVIID